MAWLDIEATQGWKSCACMLSRFGRAWPFATPWIVACQAPLSMGFSKQEYWNGLPCCPPGELPNPGIEPESLMFPALAGGFLATSATLGSPWKSQTARKLWELFLRNKLPPLCLCSSLILIVIGQQLLCLITMIIITANTYCTFTMWWILVNYLASLIHLSSQSSYGVGPISQRGN